MKTPGKIKIMVGGQVVGLTDKPIHITTENYTKAEAVIKPFGASKAWEISAQTTIQKPGDMLRDILNEKRKFKVTIMRELSGRLPRKMKKAHRSDHRRNTKWLRKLRNYISRNIIKIIDADVRPHANGILIHRGHTAPESGKH